MYLVCVMDGDRVDDGESEGMCDCDGVLLRDTHRRHDNKGGKRGWHGVGWQ